MSGLEWITFQLHSPTQDLLIGWVSCRIFYQLTVFLSIFKADLYDADLICCERKYRIVIDAANLNVARLLARDRFKNS